MGGVVEEVEEAFDDAGDFVQENVIDPIKEDPLSAVATAAGYYFGGPAGAALANTAAGVAQGEELDDAIKGGLTAGATAYVGGELFGGDGGVYGGDVEAQLGGFYGEPYAPVSTAVPATAEYLYPGLEQGAFTPAPGSLQSALPELGVSTASAAPYTQVPGSLGAIVSAAPLAAASPALSIQDAFRGARLVQGLLTPQQQMQYNPYAQMQGLQQPQGSVDYSEILNLLSKSPQATGLLGTQYQPQPINISTLLG